MSDMTEVREAIDNLLLSSGGSGRHDGRLVGAEWERIKAAIDAAQPSDVDGIRAALKELDDRVSPHKSYDIILWPDGTSTVRQNKSFVQGCDSDSAAIAAIRALIPKPEPTLKELLETVSAYVDVDSTSRSVTMLRDAREALARARKQLE